MKHPSFLVVGLLSLTTLACSGTTVETIDYSSFAVEVSPPWDTMNLPIGDGAVLHSDESLITINYMGGDVNTLAEQYGAAVEAAGFMVDTRNSLESVVSIQYHRDDAKGCSLNIADAQGTTVVSLSLLDL